MHAFYHPETNKTEVEIKLSETESLHCSKVLRLKAGDEIHIFNGKGGIFNGKIAKQEKKQTIVAIQSQMSDIKERDFKIHLAIAPTKNTDRIEWFVEKAIEIGIDKITFILSRYSERKHLRLDRIHKIAVSAMKQSYNPFYPEITELQKFEDFLKSDIEEKEKYLAYEETATNQSLIKQATPNSSYCIIVGPEGGFNTEELQSSEDAGFEKVSLGPNRLRTETAGVVACNILNMIHLR